VSETEKQPISRKKKREKADYRYGNKARDKANVDSILTRDIEVLEGEVHEQIIIKETDLRASLERVLKMPISLINEHTQVVEERLVTDWISIALTAQAMKGNIQAIREIWDRIEGKPAQKMSIENQTKTLDTEDSEVLRNVRDKVTEMLEHVERKA